MIAVAKTHEQFLSEIRDIHPSIKVIGKYSRAIDRIEVRCMRCGYSWELKAYSLVQGKGCPHCSAIKGTRNNAGATGTKDTETFKKQLNTVDSSIEVIGKYINNKSKIECRCNRCGNLWSARPDTLLRGHGCPRCMRSGTSFMEQFILLSMKKVFGDDKVFSRDKSLIGMELDIYIPHKAFAIEPGNWYLHRRNIQRDTTKRIKCEEKGIILFTIYDQFRDKPDTLPFTDNCFCYEGDYNRSDHAAIRSLVIKLLDTMETTYSFTENEWKEIEEQAYSNSLSITTEDFKKSLSEINKDIAVIGEYKNANIRIKVKCKKCGYEWNAVPASLLAGDGCRRCGSKKAHEKFLVGTEEYKRRLSSINPDIEVLGDYSGGHSRIHVRCKVCGYEWNPVAKSLYRGSSHKGAKSIHKLLNS